MNQQVQIHMKKLNKQDDDGQSQSVISLGRRSSRSCQSSSQSFSQNKHRVKSVEGGDSDDDIYEYYLIDEGKKIRLRSSISSRGGSAAGQSEMEIQEPIRRRRSSSNKVLAHECQCDDNNCLSCHCPCYNEPNQMCMADSCCPDCIKMKIQLLQATQPKGQEQNKSHIKNPNSKVICSNNSQKTGEKSGTSTFESVLKSKQIHQEIVHQKSLVSKNYNSSKNHKSAHVISCSCKKSHCLKKYCACYALGKKCSPGCQCEQCLNFAQTGKDQQQNQKQCDNEMKDQSGSDQMMQLDIDQFLSQKNYDNQMMPSSMQFEYPDIRHAYHI